MPAKNVHHDVVVRALIADGWTITDDPLRVSYGDKDLFVDLGAELTMIGAEKADRQIAVEIQSFLNPSPVRDLQEAVGQYQVYRAVLGEIEPDRMLYLAVSRQLYDGILTERFGQLIVNRLQLRILVFDVEQQKVIQWTS